MFLCVLKSMLATKCSHNIKCESKCFRCYCYFVLKCYRRYCCSTFQPKSVRQLSTKCPMLKLMMALQVLQSLRFDSYLDYRCYYVSLMQANQPHCQVSDSSDCYDNWIYMMLVMLEFLQFYPNLVLHSPNSACANGLVWCSSDWALNDLRCLAEMVHPNWTSFEQLSWY